MSTKLLECITEIRMEKPQRNWKNFIRIECLEMRFKPEISEIKIRCTDFSIGTQKRA
jgi:hypothetical protein